MTKKIQIIQEHSQIEVPAELQYMQQAHHLTLILLEIQIHQEVLHLQTQQGLQITQLEVLDLQMLLHSQIVQIQQELQHM